MTTPNRNFEAELRSYERSRTSGTEERKVWAAYPGEALKAHTCMRYECVAYAGPVVHETYYLCPECAKLAPCSIKNYLHAPYKQMPPKKKRQMASAVCLASFFRARRYRT